MQSESARQRPEIKTFLGARVEELRRLAPKALRTAGAESIHHARVATRRLKSALDLLEPVVPEDARADFAQVLKRLRRALGPLRDNDVMAQHLAEYQKQPTHSSPAQWFLASLNAERKELHRKAQRKAPISTVLKGLGTWWAMEEELDEAAQAAPNLVKHLVSRQLASFVERADRLARLRLEDSSQQHEDVHAVRIDGKRLRYTLELAIPAGFELPASVFRTFKKLQDALGLWHDYVVLGEELMRRALDREVTLHDPHLYGQVLALANRCWRDSESKLNQFSRLWSKTGPIVQSEIIRCLKLQPARTRTVHALASVDGAENTAVAS
jgi:CHAD domain-containing protein